ncbi:hypothetical protein C922_00644 [Plasmodium inui San Antonio 1]|uniref:U1 small nuclear ribonucleoprotein C n=1 Tax=Plasmodium inui San Antonio 1 TaxID=1237626 RepID=W7ACA7_9APIC|nr:hypothetical protein C922_00644 [Plasmodium inui San Antonio 1]EUD68953.1 hypothetical protein C922_00644 [Plasmodium inui San Antonio 1]
MPKYYCEYCDIHLTHSSPVGRRQHIQGRKHISAKIEYFQNLLREEGITPQNFLGFLGTRALNNLLGNPMMNNMIPGNFPMHMKYNNMKPHSHYSRHSHRHHMSHGRYSRERHGHHSYSSKYHSHPMRVNSSSMGGMSGFQNSKHSGSFVPSPNSMHGNGKMFNYPIRDLVSNVNNDIDPSKDSQNEERIGDNSIDNPHSRIQDRHDQRDHANRADHADQTDKDDNADPVHATR